MGKVRNENELFWYALGNTGAWVKYHLALLNRNKKIVAVVVLTVMAILMGITVSAAERKPQEKPADWKDHPGYFNSVTFNMIEDIFTGDDTATVAEQVKVMYDSSGSNIKIGGKNIQNLGGIIKSVNDMCKGLAILFLIITFLLGLLAIREREQMDEELVRRFVMFIFGMACVYFAMTWCFAIANIGSEMAGKIAQTGAGIQNATNEAIVSDIQGKIWDETHIANYDHGGDGFVGGFDFLETYGGNLGMSVSYMTELIIPWLFMKVARTMVSVVVWGRALEVMILATFSPLGFAETPDPNNPISGPGMRFIKNMVALSISGAIIVFVMFATNQIILNMFSDIVVGNTTEFSDIMSSIFSMVIVSFARVAMVTRSQQIAKNVVGAM
ncbi:hypothetical protein [Butyrivibrio sp. AC2005]|uniref:hypothetical protein n=1 Tax=Butyrivibrio sp. AC2005 TaxID=1280672 RepID=UPI0003F78F87|nr:hypothetical protein [Butyrivibrio sp. AC2005]